MTEPKFKARTSRQDRVYCNWCGHDHDIWDEPSKWLPSCVTCDYEDEPKKCEKCGQTFYVSTETTVEYEFTSRFKPFDEFDNPGEAF